MNPHQVILFVTNCKLQLLLYPVLNKLRRFFSVPFTILAPGSYDVEKAEKKIHGSTPAYSLGVKYKESKREISPGKFSFKYTAEIIFQF